MLQPRHRHVHDPGRGVHAPLQLLRRRPWPAQAAGRAGAGQPGAHHRRHGAALRGHHLGGQGRPARRRRPALRRLHPRSPCLVTRDSHRDPDPGLPRQGPHGPRARGAEGQPAGRVQPQPRDGTGPVPECPPGRRLRVVAAAVAALQGPAPGRAHQVGHHARAGRDARTGAQDPAGPARPRRGHDHHRPVPAADPAPPPGAALLDAGRIQGIRGAGPGHGLHPRGFRADGALVLPRRPDGGRGRFRRVAGGRGRKFSPRWRSKSPTPASRAPIQPEACRYRARFCPLRTGTIGTGTPRGAGASWARTHTVFTVRGPVPCSIASCSCFPPSCR